MARWPLIFLFPKAAGWFISADMRIGILKCGPMHPALAGKWGEYPQIYGRFLRQAEPQIDILGVDVDGGDALPDVHAADGWLISGSKHGVYEDHAWLPPLKDFLRGAVGAGVPVAGICFGHQVLAEAMGGRVVKFPGGWGLGPSGYDMDAMPVWAAPLGAHWSAHAVHKDQVVDLPPDATVIASSPFCAYAALAYGDPERPDAISVQPHPEFDEEFMRDLIAESLSATVDEPILARAKSDLGTPVNNADWARVIVSYFKNANAEG